MHLISPKACTPFSNATCHLCLCLINTTHGSFRHIQNFFFSKETLSQASTSKQWLALGCAQWRKLMMSSISQQWLWSAAGCVNCYIQPYLVSSDYIRMASRDVHGQFMISFWTVQTKEPWLNSNTGTSHPKPFVCNSWETTNTSRPSKTVPSQIGTEDQERDIVAIR